MLVSLLPDLEVSDLKKSQSNQKSNSDNLPLCCLKLYHRCSEFLYSAFKNPNQYYDLWVHGFGWMQVYFQVCMIIGDTEQHNKICGFCRGNSLHRRHMSHNCNVTSDDADNPNIKCTRKNMWRKLIGLLGGWWQHQSRMEISCHAYWLTMKISSPQKVYLSINQPLPDDWFCLISQNHIMPALFDHDFGGNREKGCIWCLSIWSPSYHQFQLGLLKYTLTSLFYYCSVPSHFLEWLDKQSSPDVPSIDQPGISRSCPCYNEYDSPDGVHTKGGRKRKCACFSSNWHW